MGLIAMRVLNSLFLYCKLRQKIFSGCMICHCSDGIGRTGTILMVLILKEMLNRESEIDAIEVLREIRNGRGKLVEDIVQFNFAIQVFEEVVFGSRTNATVDEFIMNFKETMAESREMYSRVQNVPSHTTYAYSGGEQISKLNRNQHILPPDQNMIYLDINTKEEVYYYYYIIYS